MGPTTIGFGAVLMLLGVGSYLLSESRSPTALIPAFFGLALAVAGLLACKDSLRKHAMHAAAALGLLGVLGPGFMVLRNVGKASEDIRLGALVSQSIMTLLCAVFVGLCVKSFIDARRRRQQSANTDPV